MPHFTAPDGAQLYFEKAGHGLPVLCLAGLTRNARDFDDVAPHLAGVRLIRMDYRGRARSDWTGPASYTLETEARDALALLDHLGLAQAAILGTSRGGLIAMLLAVLAPDRLLGAALNDVGPELGAEGLADIATYLGQPPRAPDVATLARARARDAAFPGVSAARWQTYLGRNLRTGPGGLSLDYDPALRAAVLGNVPEVPPDLWPLFDALAGKPVALIRGANSTLLSAETAARMAQRHPGLHLAIVPDRGHTPFLDEPEALTALGTWLDALK